MYNCTKSPLCCIMGPTVLPTVSLAAWSTVPFAVFRVNSLCFYPTPIVCIVIMFGVSFWPVLAYDGGSFHTLWAVSTFPGCDCGLVCLQFPSFLGGWGDKDTTYTRNAEPIFGLLDRQLVAARAQLNLTHLQERDKSGSSTALQSRETSLTSSLQTLTMFLAIFVSACLAKGKTHEH